MIKDLDIRRTFWDKNYLAYQQGDSVKIPFGKYIEFFKDKKVLEIGVGEGRQFEVIIDIAGEYAIADISQKVLDELMYDNIKCKYLIKDYSDNFNNQFDVIHFWYVLHHILPNELSDFIGFLCNHLKINGVVIFNTPYLDYDSGNYNPNGIKTTEFTVEEIRNKFKSQFDIIVEDNSQWERSNGYVIIARKRNE